MVEIINSHETFFESYIGKQAKNEHSLPEGEIVKVVFQEASLRARISDIITEYVEVGTIISFTRFNHHGPDFEIDFNQIPPVVPARGLWVYDEDGETVIIQTPFG